MPTTAAIRLITRCLITGGRPEEADLLALAPFFPTWETGMDYRIGDAVRHGKKLYLVTQPHTAQPEWTPDRAINLFRVVDRP